MIDLTLGEDPIESDGKSTNSKPARETFLLGGRTREAAVRVAVSSQCVVQLESSTSLKAAPSSRQTRPPNEAVGCPDTEGGEEGAALPSSASLVDATAAVALIFDISFPEGRPARRSDFAVRNPSLRLLLPLRICLDAALTHLRAVFRAEEVGSLARLARLLEVPVADSGPTAPAAAVSSSDSLLSRESAFEEEVFDAPRPSLGEPLSPDAQLLLSRLLSQLLRAGAAEESSLAPSLPGGRDCAASRRSGGVYAPNWIRLPPLLHRAREVSSLEDALRELLERRLISVWVKTKLPPVAGDSETPPEQQPIPVVSAKCGECRFALDGSCSCAWWKALRCLSAQELSVLADKAAAALRAAGREGLVPKPRLRGRESLLSFLRSLAAGRPWTSADASQAAAGSLTISAFFASCPKEASKGGALQQQQSGRRASSGLALKNGREADSLVKVSRCIRDGAIEALGCVVGFSAEASLLLPLRLAFVASHAAHASALGAAGRSMVPSYVLKNLDFAAAGGGLRREARESRVALLAAAAVLPAVQRVAHLVDSAFFSATPKTHPLLSTDPSVAAGGVDGSSPVFSREDLFAERSLTAAESGALALHGVCASSPSAGSRLNSPVGSPPRGRALIGGEADGVECEDVGQKGLPRIWRCVCLCCQVRRSRAAGGETRTSLVEYLEAWLLQLRVRGLLSSDCEASQGEALAIAQVAASSAQKWLASRQGVETCKEGAASPKKRNSGGGDGQSQTADAFLLRFTAPYAWASIISQCTPLLEQRREYGLAVERLQLLLQLHRQHVISHLSAEDAPPSFAAAVEQPLASSPKVGDKDGLGLQLLNSLGRRESDAAAVFLHRVGGWYERLTVILFQHLGRPYSALETAVACLQEKPQLPQAEQRTVARRAVRIAQQILAKTNNQAAVLSWEEVRRRAFEERTSQRPICEWRLSDDEGESQNGDVEIALCVHERKRGGAQGRTRGIARKTRGSRTKKGKLSDEADLAKSSRKTPLTEEGEGIEFNEEAEKKSLEEERPWLRAFPEGVRASLLQDFLEASSLRCKLRCELVEGQPLRATQQAGKNSLFVGWSEEFLRVEALALEHYSLKGGWRGTHDEGGTLRSIFLVLVAASASVVQNANLSAEALDTEKGSPSLRLLNSPGRELLVARTPRRRAEESLWPALGGSPDSMRLLSQRALRPSLAGDSAGSPAQTPSGKDRGASSFLPSALAFLPPLTPDGPFLHMPGVQHHLQALLRKLLVSSPVEVYAEVKRAVLAVYGQPIQGVQWKRGSSGEEGLSASDAEEVLVSQVSAETARALSRDPALACADFFGNVAAGLGPRGLVSACVLLAEDFRCWSGGLPDLLLWRRPQEKPSVLDTEAAATETPPADSSSTPPSPQVDTSAQPPQSRLAAAEQPFSKEFEPWDIKFVEVKGPRDRLSERQRWGHAQRVDAGAVHRTCERRSPPVPDAFSAGAGWPTCWRQAFLANYAESSNPKRPIGCAGSAL